MKSSRRKKNGEMETWSISKSEAEFQDLGGKNQYLSKAQGSTRRPNQHLVFKAREQQDAPKDRHKEDPRCAWTKPERCFSCTQLALLGWGQDTVIFTHELCYFIKWCSNFKEKKTQQERTGLQKREVNSSCQQDLYLKRAVLAENILKIWYLKVSWCWNM